MTSLGDCVCVEVRNHFRVFSKVLDGWFTDQHHSREYISGGRPRQLFDTRSFVLLVRSYHPSDIAEIIMATSARGWQMIEIVTVLVALCLISVVMRVFARIKRRVGLGVDDYLSILSMVLMIAMLIELCLCKYAPSVSEY
jgi:hypothetical protein